MIDADKQGRSLREVRGCRPPPIFISSSSLHCINSASQRCNTDKMPETSSLPANWARRKFICRQTVDVCRYLLMSMSVDVDVCRSWCLLMSACWCLCLLMSMPVDVDVDVYRCRCGCRCLSMSMSIDVDVYWCQCLSMSMAANCGCPPHQQFPQTSPMLIDG